MSKLFLPTPEQIAQHRRETKIRYKILTGDAETLSALIEEHIDTEDVENRFTLYGEPFYDHKNGLFCQCVVRNVR